MVTSDRPVAVRPGSGRRPPAGSGGWCRPAAVPHCRRRSPESPPAADRRDSGYGRVTSTCCCDPSTMCLDVLDPIPAPARRCLLHRDDVRHAVQLLSQIGHGPLHELRGGVPLLPLGPSPMAAGRTGGEEGVLRRAIRLPQRAGRGPAEHRPRAAGRRWGTSTAAVTTTFGLLAGVKPTWAIRSTAYPAFSGASALATPSSITPRDRYRSSSAASAGRSVAFFGLIGPAPSLPSRYREATYSGPGRPCSGACRRCRPRRSQSLESKARYRPGASKSCQRLRPLRPPSVSAHSQRNPASAARISFLP